MRKKFLAVLVAITVLSLAGCQEKDADDRDALETTLTPTEAVELGVAEGAAPTDIEQPMPTEASEPTLSPVSSKETDAGVFLYEKKEDGTIAIMGLQDKSLAEVVIPKELYGMLVTEIGGYAFANYSSLISVEIPNSVTTISVGAFEGCSNLTSIKIPDSVTEIGSIVFSGCSSLTNLELPDSITYIAEYAFENCSSLASIKIPDGVTKLWSCLFSGCSSLTSVELPDSLTHIYDGVFHGCSSLTSIELPTSLTKIVEGIFNNCTNLEIIIAPKGSYAEQWAIENGFSVQNEQ